MKTTVKIPPVNEPMDTNKEPISAFAVYSRAGKRKRGKGLFNFNNKIMSNGIKLQNNISVRKSEHSKHKADIVTQIKNSDGMKKLYKEHLEEVDESDVLKKKNKRRRKKNANSSSENGDERSEQKFYIGDNKVNIKGKEKNEINVNSKDKKKVNRVDSPFTPNMNSAEKKDYSKFLKRKNLVPLRSIKEKSASCLEEEEEEDDVDVEDEDNLDTTNVSYDEELMSEDAVSSENEEQQKPKANELNSVDIGKELFEWIIKPMKENNFMSDYWEKQPLVVTRDQKDYYTTLLSTPIMDKMLRDNVLYFGKHLDVTSYSDGKRETHNQDGRAQPHVVWDYYTNGCSIRLLNPQAFIPKIHTLNANLQEYFGCFVGANVYLTPAGTQGFAPHYDDIEAFVLQIEGKKRWRVYPPRNKNEELPRFSSPNFAQDEIGTPILDVILKAGDLMYFPRGYIHQGITLPESHSLHITLSVYQKTAWVDLLEKALPEALIKAAKEDVEFRKGLPHGYLHCAGLGRNKHTLLRKRFMSQAKALVEKLVNYVDMDAAVDKMGTQFMHDALPPVLIPDEVTRSVYGGGLTVKEEGRVSNRVEIELDTEVKLIRAHCCRLIEEEGEFRLYHSVDNPLEYHAEDAQYLVIPQETVHIIQYLTTNYPCYTTVQSIPHEDEEEKLRLISDLWDRGLLLTSAPLESIDDSITEEQVCIDDEED